MSAYDSICDFSTLLGKVLTKVEKGEGSDGDLVKFVCEDGTTYKLEHFQSCCEHVYIEDINGNLEDLVGSPILMADESSSEDRPEDVEKPESETWTFYKLATAKGFVDIRWYGSSNGCYSESATFYKVE